MEQGFPCLSVFSPTPHRACGFHRTRRSIGMHHPDWWLLLRSHYRSFHARATAFTADEGGLFSSSPKQISALPLPTFRCPYLLLFTRRPPLLPCSSSAACNGAGHFITSCLLRPKMHGISFAGSSVLNAPRKAQRPPKYHPPTWANFLRLQRASHRQPAACRSFRWPFPDVTPSF